MKVEISPEELFFLRRMVSAPEAVDLAHRHDTTSRFASSRKKNAEVVLRNLQSKFNNLWKGTSEG